MTIGPWDHLLVVAITILLPIHDLLFWYPRMLRADAAGVKKARHRAYLESILTEWTLVALVGARWATAGRAWPDLGLGAPSGWGFWIGLGITVAVMVGLTWQRISVLRSEDEQVQEDVRRQIAPLRPLLPRSRGEMLHFTGVSITAGICEEILFRGFLIWYLSALTPRIPALFVAALLFGMAHAYQGTRGVIQTGVVGVVLVALYVLTGSLWIPMAIHLFLDLNSGLLAYRFLGRTVTWTPPPA